MQGSCLLYLYLVLYLPEVQLAKQELSLAHCTSRGRDFLTERSTKSHHRQARVACRFTYTFRDTRTPPSLFCYSVACAAEDAEPLLCSRGLNNRKMDARDTMGSPSRAAAAAPLHLTWRNSRAIVTGETDERRRASERAGAKSPFGPARPVPFLPSSLPPLLSELEGSDI